MMVFLKFSFPSQLKIKVKSDFDRVFQKGKKSAARKFAVFFYANNLTYPRLGIVVTKKNLRLAVERNTFKRNVRESFRLHQNLVTGFDIVVFAYNGVNLLDKKILHQELIGQWQKLNALSGK